VPGERPVAVHVVAVIPVHPEGLNTEGEDTATCHDESVQPFMVPAVQVNKMEVVLGFAIAAVTPVGAVAGRKVVADAVLLGGENK
jgi:hypothetical protein